MFIPKCCALLQHTGLLACFGFYALEMHRVNLSIREIDELSAE